MEVVDVSLVLQQRDPRFLTGALGFFVPDAALDFADMGAAQEEHTQAALADAAADGVGELTAEQFLVEGQLPAVVTASQGQLAIQGFGADADAHGGDLIGLLEGVVPEQQVAVQIPVIVVRRSAIVGLAGFQLAADLHQEYRVVLLHEGILPFLGGQVGVQNPPAPGW